MIFREEIFINFLGVSFILTLVLIAFYHSVMLIKECGVIPDVHMKALIWVEGIAASSLGILWLYLLARLIQFLITLLS